MKLPVVDPQFIIAAQHDFQLRIFPPHRLRRALRHRREAAPIRIQMKIPMGKIIGLIPQHHGFEHAVPLLLSWLRKRVTEGSFSMAAIIQSRAGTRELPPEFLL